jgi:putative Ca2+/H+ antiporter (TMEM165/GDT1 family)
LADGLIAAFFAVAAALFITELTDKDALLLLTLSTRLRAVRVFLAGATAFTVTTALIVALGTFLIGVVPIFWVKIAGGGVMVVYALWEARGLVGRGAIEAEESKLSSAGGGWRAFFAMVSALALLDLAGDATEVLTLVLVAQYQAPLFVFSGCLAGLLAATAVETALGNRLGRVLTPGRIRYASVVVFLALGLSIIFLAGT